MDPLRLQDLVLNNPLSQTAEFKEGFTVSI